MPLRKLGIGTYVAASPNGSTANLSEEELEKVKANPFHPIATATLSTRVFDVVHMFSERGISAVPIIDDNGVVVNLYETVDVMVSIA
jgi:CBS-domain-containing membrane protein